jgi:hypothetical protein
MFVTRPTSVFSTFSPTLTLQLESMDKVNIFQNNDDCHLYNKNNLILPDNGNLQGDYLTHLLVRLLCQLLLAFGTQTKVGWNLASTCDSHRTLLKSCTATRKCSVNSRQFE